MKAGSSLLPPASGEAKATSALRLAPGGRDARSTATLTLWRCVSDAPTTSMPYNIPGAAIARATSVASTRRARRV